MLLSLALGKHNLIPIRISNDNDADVFAPQNLFWLDASLLQGLHSTFEIRFNKGYRRSSGNHFVLVDLQPATTLELPLGQALHGLRIGLTPQQHFVPTDSVFDVANCKPG